MNTPNSRCNISFSENDYYSCSSFLPVLELPPHNSSLNMTTHLNDYEAIYLQFHDLFNDHHQQQQQQYCSSSKIAKRAVDRTSKKDRHSKINTMHGPRDRRMRLSLDIARKFFNLQDLLGFDKPSQTVDWLLQNSNTAIGELEMDDEMKKGNGALLAGATTNTNTSASSCTEEVIDNSSSITGVHHHEKELEELPLICPKKKKAKKVKASSSRPMVGRESRTKARDRARERTSQKRRLITDTTTTTVIDHDKRISAIRATDEIVVFNSNVGIQNSHGLEDFNDEECAGSNKPWEASHGARQLL